MGSAPPKVIDPAKAVDLSNAQGDLYSRGFPKRFETYHFFSIVEGKENRKAFSQSMRKLITEKVSEEGSKTLISTLKDVKEDHARIRKFKENQNGVKAERNPVTEDDDDDGLLAVANALIAFTYSGLAAIQEGLATSDSLELFKVQDTDPAFWEGPSRPSIAQDMHDPPSTEWDEPFKNKTAPIHGVLKVGGSSENAVNALLDRLKDTLQHGKVIVDIGKDSRIDGQTRPNEHRGKEHFGFMDHISQPLMEGIDDINPIKPSFSMVTDPEVLIVLENTHSEAGKRPEWMYNGSFLVFRKLEQNVAGFEKLAQTFADHGCKSKAHMGAKLMGRWETGAPIASPDFHTADSKDPRTAKLLNDFTYNGDICPAAAHIRKTNPRIINPDPNQSERFRRAAIIRNGIPYGSEYTGNSEDTSARGLLFACYQGHIEDGFEQLQLNWCNSEIFPRTGTGLDPIIGQVEQSSKGVNGILNTTVTTLTTEGEASKETTKDVSFQQLVTFRGGEYFFVPSISALQNTLGQD